MINIEKLAAQKGGLIDREIDAVFRGNIPNLQAAVRYHMGTGGKKLRPLLAIMTYEALKKKSDSTDKIMSFAASCELLHNWFLVHDDIEDGDSVRRDKPAVWVKYGLAHGINVGDYMAQKVFELILRSKKYGVDDKTVLKLVKAMSIAAVKTSEGQAMDINMRNSMPNEKDYMDMVIGKTGHYLTVTMIGAAIVAGRDELIPRLVEFGSCIGPAFQITDDVLDLTEGKGRGELGRDIKEGKKSIMIIHCLAECKADEKKKILDVLNRQPSSTSDKDVAFVIGLLGKYGSVEYAKNKAEKLKQQANQVISKLPPELHEILEFFADYLVNRKK